MDLLLRGRSFIIMITGRPQGSSNFGWDWWRSWEMISLSSETILISSPACGDGLSFWGNVGILSLLGHNSVGLDNLAMLVSVRRTTSTSDNAGGVHDFDSVAGLETARMTREL
jgi:hypothetical protein